MILEVTVKKKAEKGIKDIDWDFYIEKDDWYFKLCFPLKNRDEIDPILKKLSFLFPEEILNVSVTCEQDYIMLPCNWRISFAKKSRPSKKEILIKKGLSFGANHPTTIMSIELLMILKDLYQKKVLDLGTGSGILAIAAKKLGAKEVYAVDIDFQSCREARYNIFLNHLDNIKVICGNEECIKSSFDLIMANIIFHTLKDLIKKLIPLLKKRGFLIISGFLSSSIREFVELLGKDSLIETKEKEGWGAILWQKE